MTPGDLATWMTHKAGFDLKPGCSCSAFKKKMNAWGWLGCWKNRQEIIQWFTAQAKNHGIELTSETALGLLQAGLREFFTNRNNECKSAKKS